MHKIAHGSRWLKVFCHSIPEGGYFNGTDDPKDIDDPGKFSILNKLPQLKKSKDYVFLLDYDELPNVFNMWKQTNSPLSFLDAETNYGFKCLKCTWKNKFFGLGLSKEPHNSFLDGDKRANCWRFAIAARHSYTQENTFPGYFADDDSTKDVNNVNLWLWESFITINRVRNHCTSSSLLLCMVFPSIIET